MESEAKKTSLRLKGNLKFLFTQILFYSFVSSLLFAIVLAWQHFPLFAFWSFIALVLCFLSMFWSFSFVNWANLDFSSQEIVFPGRHLSFSQIKKVVVTEDMEYFNVTFFQHGWRRKSIFSMANEQKNEVIEALKPHFPLSRSHNVGYKVIILFLLTIFVIDFYAVFHYLGAHPLLQIIPRKVAVELPPFPEGEKRRTMSWQGVDVNLPVTFVTSGFDPRAPLVFQHVRSKAIFQLSPSFYDSQSLAMRVMALALFNVDDSFDFNRLGLYAQGGVIPLMLKSFLTFDVDNLRIYEFDLPLYKGFIINGSRYFTYRKIWIQNKADGSNLEIEISDLSPRRRESVMQILHAISFKKSVGR